MLNTDLGPHYLGLSNDPISMNIGAAFEEPFEYVKNGQKTP